MHQHSVVGGLESQAENYRPDWLRNWETGSLYTIYTIKWHYEIKAWGRSLDTDCSMNGVEQGSGGEELWERNYC